MGSLNCLGILWSFLSFISMGLSCVGFYMPFWLHGRLAGDTPAFLGTFRRCNYHKLGDSGNLVVVRECGRYATFADIPSLWWQIASVTIGVGCGLSIIVAFTAMFACCIGDVLSRTTSKIMGVLQFLSGLLMAGGIAIYPVGWNSGEVKQLCGGTSEIYTLGACTLSWAFYISVVGAATSLVCSLLTCHVVKMKMPKSKRARYRPQNTMDPFSDGSHRRNK